MTVYHQFHYFQTVLVHYYLLQVLPLIGCLIIFTTPAWKVNQIRNYALSLAIFLLSLVLWILFDPTSADWQFRYDLKCLFNQPYATDLMPDTSLGNLFHLFFVLY
jgi:NADH:ubiquinone oxidoreductase subunit 4 (subunit M)